MLTFDNLQVGDLVKTTGTSGMVCKLLVLHKNTEKRQFDYLWIRERDCSTTGTGTGTGSEHYYFNYASTVLLVIWAISSIALLVLVFHYSSGGALNKLPYKEITKETLKVGDLICHFNWEARREEVLMIIAINPNEAYPFDYFSLTTSKRWLQYREPFANQACHLSDRAAFIAYQLAIGNPVLKNC